MEKNYGDFTTRGMVLAILFALLSSFLVGVFIFCILLRMVPEISPTEAVKISLTVLGSGVAIVYLAIKFRDQRISERGENRGIIDFVDSRFNGAVKLLGEDSHISKIASIYQLVGIADSYPELYGQKVATLLCSYLRSKREADSKIIEEIVWEEIVSRVEDIKIPEARSDWSYYYFNFSGAVFYSKVSLHKVIFKGKVYFDKCTFLENFIIIDSEAFYLDFKESVFSENFLLENVIGCEYLNISDAKFLHNFRIDKFQIDNVLSLDAKFFSQPAGSSEGLMPTLAMGVKRSWEVPGVEGIAELNYVSSQGLEEYNLIIDKHIKDYFLG